MELIFPTIEHKRAAFEYRQVFFVFGEMEIQGDTGLDKAASYRRWLKVIQADVTRR